MRHERALHELRPKEGKGDHPHDRQSGEERNDVKKFARQLGPTPSVRQSVKIALLMPVHLRRGKQGTDLRTPHFMIGEGRAAVP